MFVASNKNRKSSDLEGTPTPKAGPKQNGAKTPKSGLKPQTPKSGLKPQTPKSGLKVRTPKPNTKPGTPKSNQKKFSPKNGARKSLAVNGAPKVEKTASDAEQAPVEVAVAKSPVNKNKNRKRSLSESGAESANKPTKLAKFAGTASLKEGSEKSEDSEKDEEAVKKEAAEKAEAKRNRAARRREQLQGKKKSTSKINNIQLKQKILEGDIEVLRDTQLKIDALTAVPVSQRTNSARRKIRKLQAWLSIKGKGENDGAKVQKPKPAQKKRQNIKKDGAQSDAGTKKAQAQKINPEPEVADDDEEDVAGSDESDLSIPEDFEMGSAESDEQNSEGENSDEVVSPKFILQDLEPKPKQKPVSNKPVGNKPVGNKPLNKKPQFNRRPFNKKFGANQKKGPQKK